MSVELIEDPGDIADVSAQALYVIADNDCLPVDYARSLGGSKPTFEERPSFIATKRGKIVETIVAEDYFIPEDYYGLGPCKWRLALVSIILHRGAIHNSVSASVRNNHSSWFCPYRQGNFPSNHCMGTPLPNAAVRTFRVKTSIDRVD
ncbi:MAG TPA: hypothetical protein VJ806_00190 [Luteimonas sp.]|nr:hypothetical protein [Luteimonas sp.]